MCYACPIKQVSMEILNNVDFNLTNASLDLGNIDFGPILTVRFILFTYKNVMFIFGVILNKCS